jgi:hypothetical protein
MEVKWYTKEECIATIEAFVKKFDDGSLDVEDTETFFKGLFGAIYKSMDEEDEDKQELWENMEEDLEEFDELEYFLEIRDTDLKYIMALTPDKIRLGQFTGDYASLNDNRNSTWMDWTPACQVKIMRGNPNTDAEFFSGDCVVKGSTRLASRPRQWIYDFFDFIDREVE